jgi:hypothetical protein
MMTKSVSINADLSTLQVYRSGSIIGNICVEIDGEHFPSADWSDFAFVIIGNWLQEGGKLARGECTSVTLFFFDGPYCINVSNDTKNMCKYALIKRGSSQDHVISSGIIDFSSFFSEINRFARILLKWADENNVMNEDIRDIKGLIK